MTVSVSRYRKRTLAAARLALLYTAGVAGLVVTLGMALDGPGVLLEALRVLSLPSLICFGVAFLLLAFARRAGFTVLWLVTLSLWVWVSFGPQPHGAQPERNFMAWSVLSLPLHAIVIVGFATGPTTRRGNDRTWWRRSHVITGLWILLALLSFGLEFDVSGLATSDGVVMRALRRAVEAGWYLAPVAITFNGIWRVHRTTITGAPAA